MVVSILIATLMCAVDPLTASPPPAPPPAPPASPPAEEDPQERAAEGRERPVRVLYCTHSAGFRHDVLPRSREVMLGLGAEHAWFDVTVTDEVDAINAATLATLDILMLYTSGTLPLDESQRAALKEFVAQGGAIVGIHSATDTFHDWPWYVEAIGGTFDGHPWHETVTVRVEDREHPATSHLGATFEIHDEIYQFRSLNPKRQTLLSLETSQLDHSVQDGREYPLAWTIRIGKGRVFYTAFGHRHAVWEDRRFIDHLLGGLRWAALGDAAVRDGVENDHPGVQETTAGANDARREPATKR